MVIDCLSRIINDIECGIEKGEEIHLGKKEYRVLLYILKYLLNKCIEDEKLQKEENDVIMKLH